MTDRPTQPPEANGGEDDLDADPMVHAPSWGRHLDKRFEGLAQLVAERFEAVAESVAEHETKEEVFFSHVKAMISQVIDNHTELQARLSRIERLILSHDARLADHEARLLELEGGLAKPDG